MRKKSKKLQMGCERVLRTFDQARVPSPARAAR